MSLRSFLAMLNSDERKRGVSTRTSVNGLHLHVSGMPVPGALTVMIVGGCITRRSILGLMQSVHGLRKVHVAVSAEFSLLEDLFADLGFEHSCDSDHPQDNHGYWWPTDTPMRVVQVRM